MKEDFFRKIFRKKTFILVIGSIFFTGHILAVHTSAQTSALSLPATTNQQTRDRCLQVSFFLLGWGVKLLSSYWAKQSIDQELFALEPSEEKALVPPVFMGRDGAGNVSKGLATGLTDAVRTFLTGALLSAHLPRQQVSLLISAFSAGSSFPLFYKSLDKIVNATINVGKGAYIASSAGLETLLSKMKSITRQVPEHEHPVQLLTCGLESNGICLVKGFVHEIEEMLVLHKSKLSNNVAVAKEHEALTCNDAFNKALLDLLTQGGVLTLGALISVLGSKVGALAAQLLVSDLLGVGEGALHKATSRYAEMTLLVFLGKMLFGGLRTAAEQFDPEYLKNTVLVDEEKFATTLLAAGLGTAVYRFILPKEIAFLKNIGIPMRLPG